MVTQGGAWFLPDRVIAEFTNEPASEANRRAHDRNGLELVQASRSQVIDFACHQKNRLKEFGDTIHEKVSLVIAARHETARKAEELRRAGNTLRELQGLLESSAADQG